MKEDQGRSKTVALPYDFADVIHTFSFLGTAYRIDYIDSGQHSVEEDRIRP